jgi:hypothetical protein
MGVVPMKVVDSFSHHGDVCLTYAVYIYCDNCGSFDIKKNLGHRQWLLIIGGFLLGASIIYLKYVLMIPPVKLYTFGNVDWLILLFVFLTLGLLVFAFWGFPAYRCRKCGKSTTIRYNTRHYPSDLSIVDVPDQLIQKYGLRGWPEDQAIEAYLSPPEDTRHRE